MGFGTGKLFEPGDQISTQEQAVYVLWDKGQVPTISKPSLQRIRLQDALGITMATNVYRNCYRTGDFRRLKAARPCSLRLDDGRFLYTADWLGTDLKASESCQPGFLDAGVLSFTSFQQQSGWWIGACARRAARHTVYRFNLIGGLGQAGFLGVSGFRSVAAGACSRVWSAPRRRSMSRSLLVGSTVER